MSKQASFRVLVSSRNNFTGDQWDIQLDGAAYGDLGDIVVGAKFISDEGGQTYYRWKVIDVDTDSTESGTLRWFRVEPDEDGTPPALGPNWNDGWIMNTIAADSQQGWKTYPEEFGINSAMDAYALNADKYAMQEDFVQFSDLIADSSGVVDAGKPIKLDASGLIDTSMYMAGGDASGTAVDATAFSGVLSGTDTDVQTALDTLDVHSHAVADITDVTGTADNSGQLMIFDGTSEWAIGYPDAVNVAATDTSWADILNGVSGDVQSALDTLDDHSHPTAEALLAMKEPTGFENNSESTWTFSNDSTRYFTIAPTGGSYDIYIKGTKYTKSGTENLTLSNADGLHYIYFNGSGVLSQSQTLWDLGEVAPIAAIYWNTSVSSGIVLEERHGLSMDWATHKYLHTTVGTRYVSGLTLSGYVLDSDTTGGVTFGVSGGKITDEDLEHNIVSDPTPTNPFEQILADPCQLTVLNRDGANGHWLETTPSPVTYPTLTTGTGRLAWNEFTGGAWQQTECTNNYFMVMWIVGTNCPGAPIKAVQGQRQDSTLIAAQNNNKWELMSFGTFPSSEYKLLYRVIYETSNGHTSPHLNVISSITDYRAVSPLPSGSYVATDHGTLSGLADQDHPASAIYTTTANFDGALTTADTSVQLALDTVSDLERRVVVTNGTQLEAAIAAGEKNIFCKAGATYSLTGAITPYDDLTVIGERLPSDPTNSQSDGVLLSVNDVGFDYAASTSSAGLSQIIAPGDMTCVLNTTVATSVGDIIYQNSGDIREVFKVVGSADTSGLTTVELYPPARFGTDDTSSTSMTFYHNPLKNLTFKNLAFDTTGSDGIALDGVDGLVAENLSASGVERYTLYVRGCANVQAHYIYGSLTNSPVVYIRNGMNSKISQIMPIYGEDLTAGLYGAHISRMMETEVNNIMGGLEGLYLNNSSVSNVHSPVESTIRIQGGVNSTYHNLSTGLAEPLSGGNNIMAEECVNSSIIGSRSWDAQISYSNGLNISGCQLFCDTTSRPFGTPTSVTNLLYGENITNTTELSVSETTKTIYLETEYIYTDSTSNAITLTIYSERLLNSRPLKIKDLGNASTNNITIATEGPETIDGQASITIDVDYAAVTLISNGTNWFLI